MDNDVIANNLAMYRKTSGLTQLELAKKVNYSDKVISKWERGESLPGIEALIILAKFFGISVDDLVSERGEEISSKESNLVEMKQIRGGNIIFKWSIIIPLVLWAFTIGGGPEWFILGGILFLVYWITYSLIVIIAEYNGTIDGHNIKIKVSPKGVTMFVDEIVVDSTGVPFVINYVLTGKVVNKRLKARIVLFFGTKCTVYID